MKTFLACFQGINSYLSIKKYIKQKFIDFNILSKEENLNFKEEKWTFKIDDKNFPIYCFMPIIVEINWINEFQNDLIQYYNDQGWNLNNEIISKYYLIAHLHTICTGCDIKADCVTAGSNHKWCLKCWQYGCNKVQQIILYQDSLIV